MFNNKIVKMKKESFVESELITYYIKDILKRKLAFANTCTLFAFRNYVEKNNFIQEPMTKLNLFRVPAIAEKYGISDIYLDDIRLDVRVSLDGKVFPIPKVHISNSIAADFYVVLKGTKNPLKCEALGYISKKDLIFDSQDDEYYYISVAILNPIEGIKDALSSFHPEEKKFYETEHKLAIENFGAFLDGDLDEVKSNDLIKHLVECPECRAYCVNYSFLEDALTGLKYYPDTIDLIQEPEEAPQQEDIVSSDLNEINAIAENTEEQQDFNFDAPTEVLADTEIIENFADGLDTDFVDLSSTEFSIGDSGDDLDLSALPDDNLTDLSDTELTQTDDINFADINNQDDVTIDNNFDDFPTIENDNMLDVNISEEQPQNNEDRNAEFLSSNEDNNLLDTSTSEAPSQNNEYFNFEDLNFDDNELAIENNDSENDSIAHIDTDDITAENLNISETTDNFDEIKIDIHEDNNIDASIEIDSSDDTINTDNNENIDENYTISDMKMEASIFDTENSDNNDQITLNENNDDNDFLLDIGEEIPINDHVEINYMNSDNTDHSDTSQTVSNDDDMGLGIPLINDDNIDEVISSPDINLHELYTNNTGGSEKEEVNNDSTEVVSIDALDDTNIITDDINTVYDKDISSPELENIEIDTPKKPEKKKEDNKPFIITVVLLVVFFAGGYAAINYMNSNNNQPNNTSNNYMEGASTDGGTKDINKAMTNAFSNAQGTIKVSKISWQVEQDLATNPDVTEYLTTLGESIGDNIDTALPYIVNTNPPALTKVLIKVNKDGTIDKVIFAESSSIEDLDNAIEQAIRKSMQSLPITSYVATKKDTNLILVVNF